MVDSKVDGRALSSENCETKRTTIELDEKDN
jgi:hypothetical protein